MIASAWNSGRPIFSRLPGSAGAYSENAIADALTAFPDSLLIETRSKIFDIEQTQIYPETASEEWLDFLSNLAGWSGGYWDVNWSVAAKRSLILNSFQGIDIWGNKGSAAVLQFILRTIGIKATVIETGPFQVGITAVGQPIGYNAYTFTIYLQTDLQGTRTVGVVNDIAVKFSPVWCQYSIVYDNSFYIETDVLASTADRAIVTAAGSGIQTNRQP